MAKRVPISGRLQEKEIDAAGGEGNHSSASKPKLEKVTMYIRPDQVAKVEEIQLSERQRTGKRPDKSDLIQEALDLLIQKYSNTSSST